MDTSIQPVNGQTHEAIDCFVFVLEYHHLEELFRYGSLSARENII